MKKLLSHLCVCLLASGAQAMEFGPNDGTWIGEYRSSNTAGMVTRLRYHIDISQDLARLNVSRTRSGTGCTFVLRLADLAVTEIAPSDRNAEACVTPRDVDIIRASDQVMMVTIPAFDPEPLILTPRRTPIADLPPHPANFDVLGVSTRQTRGQIEAILIEERGWQILKTEAQSSGLVSTTDETSFVLIRTYGAPSAMASWNEQDLAPDAIRVIYQAQASALAAQGADVEAQQIERQVLYGPVGRKVSLAQIQSALSRKYGPLSASDTPEAPVYRSYDTETGRELSAAASLEDRTCVRRNTEVRGLAVASGFLGCGTAVRSQIFLNDDGHVDALTVTLIDDAMIINDSLAADARSARLRLEPLFDLAVQAQSLPEL